MGDVVLKSHRGCSNHQGNPTGGYFGMLFSGDPHCPMKSWSFFFRAEKNSMKAIRGGISWHDIFVIYAKWMVKQVLTKTTRLFRPGYLVDFFRRQFFWQYAFMVLLKSEGWRDIKRLQIWMAQSQFSGIKAAEMPGVDAIGVLHTRIKCVHDICIYCIYIYAYAERLLQLLQADRHFGMMYFQYVQTSFVFYSLWGRHAHWLVHAIATFCRDQARILLW